MGLAYKIEVDDFDGHAVAVPLHIDFDKHNVIVTAPNGQQYLVRECHSDDEFEEFGPFRFEFLHDREPAGFYD